MGIKDDLECEWIDELIDRFCDKIIEYIPDWQIDPLKANREMNQDESNDYWRGFNAGVASLEGLVETIKDRADG
jgi:hypothetical protein